jgi:predicted lipoprotein
LIQDTELQWQAIELALANLNPNQSLQNMINAQSSALDQLFLEITKHTRFLKSEMSSLLGISITFSSSDGD